MSNKRTPENLIEEAKHIQWKKNQDEIAITRLTNDDNSDIEPYPSDQAFMIYITGKRQSGVWYLDSYALRYICNSHERFTDLRPKTYKFVTASRDIIRSNQVETIILFPFENSMELTFSNIAYAPKCNSRLIFVDQL